MLVVEAAVDRRRAAGVEVLAQVVEHAVALRGPEAALERAEELGVGGLVTAALAEELVLERVEAVDVVAGERRRPGAVDLQVGVDAADEHVDVVQNVATLRPGVQQHLGLARDDTFGLGAGLEVLQVLDQADRGETGHVDRRDAGVVARLLEQQETILGGDPAGGPDAAVVGGGDDVRHVEAVADDRHARVRDRLGRARAVAGEPEALGLEISEQVGVADVVEQRRQRVVHLGLGERAGRRGDLGLTRRDDVARHLCVVADPDRALRLDRACRHQRSGDAQRRHDSSHRSSHPLSRARSSACGRARYPRPRMRCGRGALRAARR